MLLMLVATVIGIGGPRGAPAQRLAGVAVRIAIAARHTQPLRILHTGENGRAEVRLTRGTYRVQALLGQAPCQAQTVKLVTAPGRRVTLVCSIR
jgi:hypothetical protein